MQKFPFFPERFMIVQFTGSKGEKQLVDHPLECKALVLKTTASSSSGGNVSVNLRIQVTPSAASKTLDFRSPDHPISRSPDLFRLPLSVLVFSVLAMSSLAWAGSFDKPLQKKTVELGGATSSAPTHAKVTCYLFPTFMVKEVDLGEKGASRLAILPASKRNIPACSRLRDQTEKVVNPDDWSGYFKGVRGNLVFFDADDRVNGGMGFAVYDSKTGKKIFDDAALGELHFPESHSPEHNKETTIQYARVVDGGCAVPKDQAGCWDKIKKKLGLETASAPDCQAGYESSAQQLAKNRCQAQKTDNPQCMAKEIALARQQTSQANSVIVYPVETVLGVSPTVKPVSGDLSCRPSD
jgi:hypothetical protein